MSLPPAENTMRSSKLLLALSAPARAARPLRGGLLLLAALSACAEPKTDPGGEERIDEDEDGVFSDEDCDDSDAAVAPGAPDSWYDGVDSDCGGDDDFDADSDGVRSADYGGADCDDGDAEISPAAPEAWYDGVDQDCAGDDDNDADGDTFAAATAGGPDCDDTLAAIRPGADEIWYDGVDQNCDADDDFDADGDGVTSALEAGGEDCDDLDADVLPGVSELWYDGIDQDCLGDDDYDADADGYAALIAGGEDCDDEDPDVFPNVAEELDGADSNCDGRNDQLTIDEDFGALSVIGELEGGGFGASVTAGDFSGDGLDDIAALQAVTAVVGEFDLPYGQVTVWDAADLLGSTTAGAATATIRPDESARQLDAVVFLGDVGGSPAGRADLAITSVGAVNASAQQIGKVWIFRNSALESATSFLTTTWTLEGAPSGTPTEFGAAVASTPDMDGDGFAEVIVGAPGASGGAAHLFLSSTLGPTSNRVIYSVADADSSWTAQGASDRLGTAVAGLDYDDDGRGDLLLGAPGYQTNAGAVYLIAGDLTLASEPVASAYHLRLTSTVLGERAGEALTAGDFDGDGADDLAIGLPRATSGAGKVYVTMSAAFRTIAPLSSRAISTLSLVNYGGTGNSDGAGSAFATPGDVNGDGKDDLFVGGAGADGLATDAGAAWLITELSTGARALADVPVSFAGTTAGDGVGGALALGDIDGDGLKDVIFGVPGGDTYGDEGAVLIGRAAW